MIEIKHRLTEDVLFCADVQNSTECVKLAVKEGANLFGADLSGANLFGADLSGANLSGTDLSGANLFGANLFGADLSRANLSRANLSRANLFGANLSGANLSRADLSGANLSRADLSGANLFGANLSGANLFGANLSGALNADIVIAQQNIIAEGNIIGWKKLHGNVIAKLLIPTNAKRVNAIGSRKCRASMAIVLELSHGEQAVDQHTGRLVYKVGATVEPDSFDDSVFVECSHGVHFFITKIEAENY